MVSQKYRWDFIGLSTDTKPTSETSDKVVNGSTYYCSDTSKLYVYCNGTWYERKPLGGGGTSDFNDLSNRPKYNGSDMTGSTNIPEVKTYTAGSNVAISDQNVISATDTTYSAFTGTDGQTAGTAGLVPAPATTDAGKFLKADGTWDTAGGGGGPTVVQTTGSSTTDVMSQKAVTDTLFRVSNPLQIQIGASAAASGSRSIAIGGGSTADKPDSIAIGTNPADKAEATGNVGVAIGTGAKASGSWTVALGTGAKANTQGQMDISTGSATTSGYNGSNYRLLTGVHDPVNAHDAATKGYVDPTTDSSAPTTATVGRLGQIQIDTTTATAYMCVAVDSVTPSYTWKKITA